MENGAVAVPAQCTANESRGMGLLSTDLVHCLSACLRVEAEAMTDTADREAELLAPIEAHGPRNRDCRGECATFQDKVLVPELPAVAVGLARALRAKGEEVDGKGWHLRECALAYDWGHYQIESPCTCEPDRQALARWDEVLAQLPEAQ